MKVISVKLNIAACRYHQEIDEHEQERSQYFKFSEQGYWYRLWNNIFIVSVTMK
jgi:hypothetical protein